MLRAALLHFLTTSLILVVYCFCTIIPVLFAVCREDGDGDDFNDEYEPAEGNNEEDGLVEGSASDQALEEFVSAGDVLCAEGLSYVDRKLSRLADMNERLLIYAMFMAST